MKIKYKEFINENIIQKNFVINKKNNKFELYLNDILVSECYFDIEQPNEFFNEIYVSIFKLKTNDKYLGKGFAKYLLIKIFNYVKNELNINNILLNVYKNNKIALNLYLNNGFQIYKDYDNIIDDDPYFTLIKKL